MNATSKRILSRCDSELSGHNLFLGPYMANELAMGFVLALFCQDVHRYADSHKTLSADDDCSFFGLLLLPKRRKTSLLGVHHGLECSLFCHFGNRFLSFERQTQYEKNAVFWGNGMHENVFY